MEPWSSTFWRTHLDVVGDEDLAVLEHLQRGTGQVVRDGVALDDVLGGHHLPGQPSGGEHGVGAEQTWQVAGIATAAAVVVLHVLGDGLHLALLAVGATELEATHLEGAQAVAQFDDVHQTVEIVGGEHCSGFESFSNYDQDRPGRLYDLPKQSPWLTLPQRPMSRSPHRECCRDRVRCS